MRDPHRRGGIRRGRGESPRNRRDVTNQPLGEAVYRIVQARSLGGVYLWLGCEANFCMSKASPPPPPPPFLRPSVSRDVSSAAVAPSRAGVRVLLWLARQRFSPASQLLLGRELCHVTTQRLLARLEPEQRRLDPSELCLLVDAGCLRFRHGERRLGAARAPQRLRWCRSRCRRLNLADAGQLKTSKPL